MILNPKELPPMEFSSPLNSVPGSSVANTGREKFRFKKSVTDEKIHKVSFHRDTFHSAITTILDLHTPYTTT